MKKYSAHTVFEMRQHTIYLGQCLVTLTWLTGYEIRTSINKPNHSDFLNTTETAQAAVKSIWLPSVGTLQLSESSILKRRESRKRRKRMASKGPTSIVASAASTAASITTNSISCDAKKKNLATIRHRGCNVDLETIAWIESGLNRLANDSELMTNVLLKWNTFLKQHVMQNLSQVSFSRVFFSIVFFKMSERKNMWTGKSLSEALIFAPTNPQYDNRLFIELKVQ